MPNLEANKNKLVNQNIKLNTLRKFSTYFTENTLRISVNTQSPFNIKQSCKCNEQTALNCYSIFHFLLPTGLCVC